MKNQVVVSKEAPVALVDNKAWTTSNVVAEMFGKPHKTVLRAIENLDCSSEYHRHNFALMINPVETGKGAVRDDKAYALTRDGFTFLAMGFTGKEAARWKEKYIAAFNAMEARLLSDVHWRYEQIEKAAANQIELLESKLADNEQDLARLRNSEFKVLDHVTKEVRDAAVIAVESQIRKEYCNRLIEAERDLREALACLPPLIDYVKATVGLNRGLMHSEAARDAQRLLRKKRPF